MAGAFAALTNGSPLEIREDLRSVAFKGQTFHYLIEMDFPESGSWVLERTNQDWLGPFRVISVGELRGQVSRGGQVRGQIHLDYELASDQIGAQSVPWPFLRLRDAGSPEGQEVPMPTKRPQVLVVPKGFWSGLALGLGLLGLLWYSRTARLRRKRQDEQNEEESHRRRQALRRLYGRRP